MNENEHTLNICGCLSDHVPIYQTDSVTYKQAEEAADGIINAFVYMATIMSDTYNQLKNKLKEIHIVANLSEELRKYELFGIEDKYILKINFDLSYTEACYCLSDILTKV